MTRSTSDQTANASWSASRTRSPVPSSAPPAAEGVAAVEREPEREHDEQRRCERDEREPDRLARAPKVAEAPEQPHAEEHGEADDEVADEPVEPARDESPDREEDRVVLGLVQDVRRGRSREHGRDARQPDHEQERLGARGDVVGVVLAEREEDGPRAQQDGGDAQPPGTSRRQLLVRRHRLARHGRSVAAPD